MGGLGRAALGWGNLQLLLTACTQKLVRVMAAR